MQDANNSDVSESAHGTGGKDEADSRALPGLEFADLLP
jgi:hypothetical protein